MGRTTVGTHDDLEMEIISISVVDFFTGETLINTLVHPGYHLAGYNTPYSGIDERMLEDAKDKGDCLLGAKQAREALLRFVSPETIIVTHNGKTDLLVLRLIHKRVIDTMVSLFC